MITDAEMLTHLTRFLAGHRATPEALLAEVGSTFGPPLLVVASGSVLHGFGNASSDVDLHVVVDDRRVTDFPVSSHGLGVTVDTTYFEARPVRDEAAALRAGDGVPAGAERAVWKAARSRLQRLGRLSFGYALDGTDEWRAWQADLRPVFVDYAVRWWRTEALRYRTAARLLADRRPLIAAVRFGDAATAALDAYATAGGEAYIGHKWLGLKLERLGRTDLLDAYHRLLDLPTSAEQLPEYRDHAEQLVARLTVEQPLPDDPYVTLTPAEGATTWQVHDRVLVHRWGLRGVELVDGDAGADPKLAWTGQVSALPADLRLLTEEDLVWMSVSEHRP
ncbi:hypothetical protein O7634_12480 [Micromonospora sp. WMMD1120]|uniref:hypothetical protein n=1 Tax=Micromonospora sp. WMMD1120 TaxID=3016106 RepID=UPI0024169B51|nr:hypothetical protein [Micromonospora sp. WMMD1120]MDG4807568.1 hypothetical protein [Micromonospora sp. WMMD1120]